MTEQRLSVVVDTPQHAGLGGALEYLSGQPLAPGTLVRVPLGRREVAGIVWPAAPGAPGAGTDVTLRPISQCFESLPVLSDRWLALVEFAAGYYQRGLGELALAVLPPELRRLERARQSRGWSAQEVNRREAKQLPLEAKRLRADRVLENSGTPEQLEAAVAAIWEEFGCQ
jgi:primosomal protein N'